MLFTTIKQKPDVKELFIKPFFITFVMVITTVLLEKGLLYLNISEKQIYVLGKNDEKPDIEFDYCFECSGTVSGINKAINLTKYRGTIIQVGIIYNKQFNKNQFYFDKLFRLKLKEIIK